jgi:hypothetical protein
MTCLKTRKPRLSGAFVEARNETRTRDPFLTMEVLYQLSYPGGAVPIPLCNAEFGVASAAIL